MRFNKPSQKTVLFLFLFFASGMAYGAVRLYCKLNDAFLLSDISIHLPYRVDWEIQPLDFQEKEVLDQAINQPYSYLGKGHQSYVFESHDQKYVIKFLKFQRMRFQPWWAEIPFPKLLNQWREKKLSARKEMLENCLRSWKLAFNEFKNEASIVYVHINKTDFLQKTLDISDKLGFKYQLDLDNSIFLIQRKAESLLVPAIDSLLEQGQKEKAEQLLQDFVRMLVSEYNRGLAEKELHVLRNTGVLNGRPIHVDNGRFEYDAEMKIPQKQTAELQRKTGELRQWLIVNHPELAVYFKDLIGKE